MTIDREPKLSRWWGAILVGALMLGGLQSHAAEAPDGPWLQQAATAFEGGWTGSFVADCDRLLPPGHPLNDRALRATVRFTIGLDGAVQAVAPGESSNNAELDAAALEVARGVARVPTPTTAMRSDDGRVHVRWTYAREPVNGGAAHAEVLRVRLPLEEAIAALVRQGRFDEGAERLAEGGPEAVVARLSRQIVAEVLGQALDAHPEVGAVTVAGDAALAELAPRLRALAVQKGDAAVRQAALRALGGVGDRESLPLLHTALAAADADSVAAALGLARMGDGPAAWREVAPWLGEASRRARAFEVAAALGEPSSVEALSALMGRRTPLEQRVAASAALGAAARGQIGEATAALRKALEAEEPAARAAAAEALARVARDGGQSRGLFYRVMPLFQDDDAAVRRAAVAAAAGLAPDRAAGEIVALSRKEKDAGVLLACVEALARAPGEDAALRLSQLAEGGPPAVRAAAVAAKKPPSTTTGDALQQRTEALGELVRRSGAAAGLAELAALLREATTPERRRALAETWLTATRPR